MRVIDIHIHGIGGYDTRTTNEEHILRIAEILGSEGVSEIILTIYPSTIKVMRENMMTVRHAMEKQKDILNPLLPTDNPPSPITRHPSRIIGLHLEGPFLNPSKCGALNAMTFLEPKENSVRELLEGFVDVIKIITISPELQGATQLIKKISDMGIIVSMGHSDATFSEAEDGFNAGAKGITHIFNAMSSFHHREPGIAGFGLLNKDIFIEVIADPFHLHPKTLDLIFKTRDPEKIIIVSDSVKETKKGGYEGKEQVEVQAVTDAHGKLLGGSMTVVESSKRLIQMGFDEDVIVSCITENPERYLSV